MLIEVRVPRLEGGRSEVATIIRWFKKEGEHVQKDEPLLEVEFPKVTTEIIAPETGTLSKIFANEGSMVRVLDKVCLVETVR